MIQRISSCSCKCDICGEQFEDPHSGFSIFTDQESARESADNSGWKSDGDKDYCPGCRPKEEQRIDHDVPITELGINKPENWEILQFMSMADGVIVDTEIHIKNTKDDWWMDKDWVIHSAKRLRDGAIFTIGDNVETRYSDGWPKDKMTIQSFSYIPNYKTLRAHWRFTQVYNQHFNGMDLYQSSANTGRP
jgi:hypothetical protein